MIVITLRRRLSEHDRGSHYYYYYIIYAHRRVISICATDKMQVPRLRPWTSINLLIAFAPRGLFEHRETCSRGILFSGTFHNNRDSGDHDYRSIGIACINNWTFRIFFVWLLKQTLFLNQRFVKLINRSIKIVCYFVTTRKYVLC